MNDGESDFAWPRSPACLLAVLQLFSHQDVASVFGGV